MKNAIVASQKDKIYISITAILMLLAYSCHTYRMLASQNLFEYAGADFLAFTSAASVLKKSDIKSIYNLRTLKIEQDALLKNYKLEEQFARRVLPLFYPPLIFALFLPFTFYSLSLGFIIWLLTGAILIFWLTVIVCKYLAIKSYIRTSLLFLFSVPVLENFYYGNINLLLLATLALCIYSFIEKRAFMFGLSIGFFSFKATAGVFFSPLLFLFFSTGTLAGFVSGLVILWLPFLLNISEQSLNQLLFYIPRMRDLEHAFTYGTWPLTQVNIHGAILNAGYAINFYLNAIIAAFGTAFVGIIIFLVKNRSDTEKILTSCAAASLAFPLFSPHAHIHACALIYFLLIHLSKRNILPHSVSLAALILPSVFLAFSLLWTGETFSHLYFSLLIRAILIALFLILIVKCLLNKRKNS